MELRVPAADLGRFARALLHAAGACPEDADQVAEALLWTDLRGLHSQGLIRLPVLVERLRRGLLRSPAALRWEQPAPALALLDAAGALGQVAATAAVDRAVALAEAHGVGVCLVKGSAHFGAAGYYCFRAAQAGCAALGCSNAPARVAPHGSAEPVFGTNPIAFACPTRSGGPVLVDLATSALSGGGVREARDRGVPLPEGVALDRAGSPTTDPTEAEQGCLLPLGGPKGTALALTVEILAGVLAGAAAGREVGSVLKTWDRPTNTGHFFLALDIARARPLPEFLDALQRLLDTIRGCSPQPGHTDVRAPGDLRARLAEEYARLGVPLPANVRSGLATAAAGMKVSLPW